MTNFAAFYFKRLPTGNPLFSDLREENMIYVDKTAPIAQIASLRAPLFFSRPRRFGKSLLLNTLSSLFTNGLKYFHGLDIEKIWKDKTYHVVHLDFSKLAGKNAHELKFVLSLNIIEEFNEDDKIVDYKSPKLNYPDFILTKILNKISNKSVILLIDEYDAPLTHHINEPDELKSIMNILNDFYATVKQYSGKFRSIFITGVTRVSHVSIFSAFNNLIDLTLMEEFDSLLGFTQNDLEQYFDPYVVNASKILNMNKGDIYKRLEQYYDGFKFTVGAKDRVYNPWSILNFLNFPKEGFKNYWFRPSGTSSLIMQYLKINDAFDFIKYQDRDIFVKENNLSSVYEIDQIPIHLLLYQAGYFTISNDNYTLRLILPNIEVEESLLELYLTANHLNPTSQLLDKMNNICHDIDSKNLPSIINIFNSILNECVSISSNVFEDERSIRDIIFAALIWIPKLQKIKERETVKGKSDLELITNNTCMIIEFKRTYTNRGPKASLNKAIEQIKNNSYGLLFSQTHTPYKVAMVISTEEKKILKDFCQEVL
ncbi:MAG: AAA family ATPase [Desulfovibrionaceae bacterium]|nr:AAA family ATPase [Desulfovibrionaceae bacterium]